MRSNLCAVLTLLVHLWGLTPSLKNEGAVKIYLDSTAFSNISQSMFHGTSHYLNQKVQSQVSLRNITYPGPLLETHNLYQHVL